MSSSREDKDTNFKLFTDGAWDGSRTPGFLKFKRDFEAGSDAYFLTDDDYSIWAACVDLDQGGQGANADPLPNQGANGHLQAVRRRLMPASASFHAAST